MSETISRERSRRMSRFSQDREELIRLILSICDYARFGYNISTYDNCNNCRVKDCEYKPEWGRTVRYNCPLWKRADE